MLSGLVQPRGLPCHGVLSWRGSQGRFKVPPGCTSRTAMKTPIATQDTVIVATRAPCSYRMTKEVLASCAAAFRQPEVPRQSRHPHPTGNVVSSSVRAPTGSSYGLNHIPAVRQTVTGRGLFVGIIRSAFRRGSKAILKQHMCIFSAPWRQWVVPPMMSVADGQPTVTETLIPPTKNMTQCACH